eukprot:c21388_g1_i2.p1 GENE.c21388_g1_i2~~c21388_g1_i2.p1  ORF type:complete len:481 (-),score=89.93 c21388_g1_i2:362-1804(-)
MSVVFLLKMITIFLLNETIYSTILQISDNKNITYEINSPPFSFGNLSFPVSGEVIFGKGCNSIKRVSTTEIQNRIMQYNTNRNNSVNINTTVSTTTTPSFIMFIEYTESDSNCYPSNMIFDCQKRSWCSSVIMCKETVKIAGRAVWAEFDQIRSKNEYKVPLVEVVVPDCDKFKNLINDALSQNYSYNLTLTEDPNPWGDMFSSIAFLLLFRILTPVWSGGCLFLALFILRKYHKATSSTTNENFFSKIRLRFTFKTICLLLQSLNHFCRILYFIVDPFYSQRIVPMVPSYIFITSTTVFDIGTHILLSFVIRELTHAVAIVNMKEKLRFGYAFMMIYFVLDYFVNIMAGLKLSQFNGSTFFVKVFFYCFMNVVLGFWYLWEGIQFLRKNSKQEKKFKNNTQNISKKILTQMSLFNSVGIILFGFAVILVSIDVVFGTIWGYFTTFAILTIILQITSFVEILLFGGVIIRPRNLAIKFLT